MISANATNNVNAQETEEEQTTIENAGVFIVICNSLEDRPYSYLNSLQEQECDYNLKFLKGLCESTNNEYDYCTNTQMDSYLIVRGQIDAPRPNDVWCDHFVDKCIEMLETVLNGFDKYGDPDDFEVINDKLDRLKEKQQE